MVLHCLAEVCRFGRIKFGHEGLTFSLFVFGSCKKLEEIIDLLSCTCIGRTGTYHLWNNSLVQTVQTSTELSSERESALC